MMMLAVPTLQKMFPFLELAFVRNWDSKFP
jgi:hypothetical protein